MDSRFNQPVRDFLAYLRVECGLAANTIVSYELDLKKLESFLAQRGRDDPATLDAPILIAHLRQLRAAGMASSSIARHLATIRAFGRFLVAYEYCEHDPAELLERPTMWKRLPQSMHTQQIDKLLAAPLPSDKLYLRDVAILETLYATGCRASELGTMSLRDFHNDVGVVKITGKGNRQRIVPVGKKAVEAIRQYVADLRPKLLRAGKPNDALFLTTRGTAVDRYIIWSMIKKHARRAGLRGIHPHTLRHTFATHMLGGGADLRVVQELLGHARVTTTQIYTHVDQSRLKAVIANHHPRP
ncbi:MAG: site-specific tyrosine recombinase XerD [Planctomycetes bacterium]|nr:site-specific tyrosine recombinase XerD [Planctomycetota bacterium]